MARSSCTGCSPFNSTVKPTLFLVPDPPLHRRLQPHLQDSSPNRRGDQSRPRMRAEPRLLRGSDTGADVPILCGVQRHA